MKKLFLPFEAVLLNFVSNRCFYRLDVGHFKYLSTVVFRSILTQTVVFDKGLYEQDVNDRINKKHIRTPAPQRRTEMKGPRDINDLLSGLKSKPVLIPDFREERDPSTVSISELKEMSNQKQPKSNRKQSNTPKNTISLDI